MVTTGRKISAPEALWPSGPKAASLENKLSQIVILWIFLTAFKKRMQRLHVFFTQSPGVYKLSSPAPAFFFLHVIKKSEAASEKKSKRG